MTKYWLWLATRKGLGLRGICAVARSFADARQAYHASAESYRAIPGLGRIDSLLDKDLTLAERIVEQCIRSDIRIVTMQDAAYPSRLRALEDAPVVLYYKGKMPMSDAPAVAVIGTRKSSLYGMTQAKRFGYGLARCGCTVVSGGALGVDTEAIRGALMAGGPVIAVLGCGLDVDHPKSNRELFLEVQRVGCLISEFPPKTAPFASNFPQRNRIISGLSLGVLVTEAPGRSGALITADRALEQGRDVFVLPANVGVSSFEGNLKLLRDGATPVGTVWDILQEYEPLYPQTLRKEPVQMPADPPQAQSQTPAQEELPQKIDVDKAESRAYIDLKTKQETLSSQELVLAELLKEGPVDIDTLVERSGLGAGAALAALTVLEIKQLVCRPSPRVYELKKVP